VDCFQNDFLLIFEKIVESQLCFVLPKSLSTTIALLLILPSFEGYRDKEVHLFVKSLAEIAKK